MIETLPSVICSKKSLGHIQVQEGIDEQAPDLDQLFSPEFIQQIHQQFYQAIPESLWVIKDHDGTGRVGRLLTDAALKSVGLESYGAWCVSRGLATGYKTADIERQGEYDGRCALTEKGLIELCDYMLDTAIEPLSYMSNLLVLSSLRKRIDSYVQARNDYRVAGLNDELKSAAGLVLYSAFIHAN